MILSNTWRDYRLLDCSDGERLESWGGVVLVRPDPYVIWQGGRSHPAWSDPHARYIRSRTGGGHWENYKPIPELTLRYGALRFHVRPTNFKHTGLFPEQAANWDWAASLIRSAGRPVRVLNLFAYTGAATLACAAAGASVCHVDAAKGMVQWAKENAAASGLAGAPIRYIVDDCAKFVQREIRRGSRYDAVILDPPSYGRGPGGEVWKLEEQLDGLVRLTLGVLTDTPLFYLLNSYTTGFSAGVVGYLCRRLLLPKFGGALEADELGLPVEASGAPLPCGASARWEAAGAGR